jgi:hypothetical protein
MNCFMGKCRANFATSFLHMFRHDEEAARKVPHVSLLSKWDEDHTWPILKIIRVWLYYPIIPNTYIYIIIYHYNGWLMSQVWRCFTDHRSPDLTHSWGPSRSLRSECWHQWRSLGQGLSASPGGSGTRGTPRGWGFLRFSTVCGCSSHHYGMVLYRPCPRQCDILGCCFILWL